MATSTDISTRLRRIHVIWHSWELKSIPRRDLHPFTERWIVKRFTSDFPEAKVFVTFDGEPVKGIDLEIDTYGQDAAEHDQCAVAERYIADVLRTFMNRCMWGDAHHRAPFLVKPTQEQLRYGRLL